MTGFSLKPRRYLLTTYESRHNMWERIGPRRYFDTIDDAVAWACAKACKDTGCVKIFDTHNYNLAVREIQDFRNFRRGNTT